MATNSNKNTPITRARKFYNQKQYDLELSWAREYLYNDIFQPLIIYRVDRKLTQADDIYGESNKEQIRFKPPIELSVNMRINQSQQTNIGGLIRIEYGELQFSMLFDDVRNYEIHLGDLVAWQHSENNWIYFQITDDGRVTQSTHLSNAGFKELYVTMKATQIDPNEYGIIK